MKRKTLVSVLLAGFLMLCGLFGGCNKETVNSDPPPAIEYTLSVDDISLLVGTEYAPDFTLKADGKTVENSVLTYRSLQTDIVSVSGGKLKAEKVGSATIEVVGTVEGELVVAQSTFVCKVNENKGIHPVKNAFVLYVSESVKGVSFDTSTGLVAFVYENGAIVENADIVWTVGDDSIATVDESGVLQAVTVGETYVVGSYTNAQNQTLKTVQLPVSVQIPVLQSGDDVIVDKGREIQMLDAESILGESTIGSVLNVAMGKTYAISENQIETASFKAGEHTCVFYDVEQTIGVQVNLVAADFVIYSKEDLLLLPSFTSGYIVLANDISDIDYVCGGNQPTFTGVLNGLGHTISNIRYKYNSRNTAQSSWGLFFRVNGATIKNIAIVEAKLGAPSGGAFFYQTQGGETVIDNTFVDISWDNTVWQVGGAFGYAWRGTVIYSNSILLVNGPTGGSNGLIAGRNNSQTIVKNSYVLGEGNLCGTTAKENNNYAVLNRVAGVAYATQADFLTAIGKGKTDFSGFNKYWDLSQDIPRM